MQVRNGQVLWGRSYESGGAPPYWPWVQAIRSHIAATEPDDLRRQLGATASVISEVVSEVKAALPEVQPPPVIEDPESARFRLFDSISTFLKHISVNQALVLMLEDLHWSDKPSLMLLEFVARELANSKILILGNYRDMELNRRHPLSVTLGDLTRERLFERVVLRGLQRHDVERFIEIAAGITPPAALVDTVHSQTEGNPLFVTETVRLLIQEGDIASGQSSKGGTTSWEIRIPEGVREVIGRRLDRLSERCNEVLTVAAVIGRQFRFPVLLKPADDVSENMLLDVMDEAVAARVIEELPEEVGLYQFTHALMQETLKSELSANRTVRMHARIAEALEDHYGTDNEKHAAELVEHIAEAEVILGETKLLEYSLIAAKQSFSSFAHEQAASVLERAMTSLRPDRDDIQAGAILSAFARAKHATGSRQTRWDIKAEMERAMSIFEREDAGDEAFQMMANFWELAGVDTGGAGLLERAIRLSALGSREEAILWSKYGRFKHMDLGDLAGALEALDHAQELADNLDDRSIKARVAVDRARVLPTNTRAEEIAHLCEAALCYNTDPEDYLLTSQATFVYHSACLRLGRVQDAVEAGIRSFNTAKIISDVNREVGAAALATLSHIISGDFESARRFVNEGLARDRRDGRIVAAAAILEYLSSGTDSGDKLVSEYVEWISKTQTRSGIDHYGITVPAAVRLVVLDDHVGFEHVQALGTNRGITEREQLTVQSYWNASETLTSGDEIHTQKELVDWQKIERQYDGIMGHRCLVESRLLVVAGNLDEAIRVAEFAIEESARDGYKIFVPVGQTQQADALFERNAPGDREKAIELQDEAIAIATELGMKPLLERVLAKREILKA